MDASFSLNFNSVETLLGYSARAAFTVNSAFREDVDIVPTIVDDSLSSPIEPETRLIPVCCTSYIATDIRSVPTCRNSSKRISSRPSPCAVSHQAPRSRFSSTPKRARVSLTVWPTHSTKLTPMPYTATNIPLTAARLPLRLVSFNSIFR